MKWFKHSEEFIDVLSEDEWLKFNPEQVGYYRVNYETEQWRQLASVIRQLSTVDRAHLVAESFAIASSGMLTYDVPLDMTKYLTGELDFVPWQVASNELSQLGVYMLNSPSLGDYKKYVLKTVTPAVNNLTWNESGDDSLLQRLTRVKVLNLACKVGHPESLEVAKTKFGKWLNGDEKLSQDLKAIIYEYGMKSASKDEWEKMWDRFVAENDAGEKLRLLSGLASVNDITLLRMLVYLAEDETYIRSQDYFTLLGYVSANPAGTSFVWDYVRENWEKLVARFGLNERYLGRLIPTITRTFSTVTKREEMEAFFKKYPDAGAGAGARVEALETVNNNIKWVKTNLPVVEEWISKNKDFSE